MSRTKPIYWNGLPYPSYAAAAEAEGCSTTQMWYYIKVGYRGSADVPAPRKKAPTRKQMKRHVSDDPRTVLKRLAHLFEDKN